MTGVLLAVPPADFMLHNSLFLVAHFHNVIIGGVLFGAFAGLTYWFPKAFGFRLHEGWGKAAFWFSLARLLRHLRAALCRGPAGHDPAPAALRCRGWRPGCSSRRVGDRCHGRALRACQVVQLVVSIRRRERIARRNRRSLGRPFARMVDGLAAAGLQLRRPAQRRTARSRTGGSSGAHRDSAAAAEPHYEPIEMPRNSPTGFITGFFATVTGFALIWHIWWLVGLGLGRRLRAFRVVRVARCRGIRDPGGGGRARRPGAAAAREEWLAQRASAEARHEQPSRPSSPAPGPLQARASARDGRADQRAARDRSRRRRPGLEARHRRLRLLDLPAQRHRDVLRFFAAFAVLQGATAGGPSGRELFDPSRVAIETALPARIELHLRAGGGRRPRRAASSGRKSGLAGHRPSRPRLPGAGGPGIRRHGRARRRPAAQRLPLRRSSPSSAATGCTSPPACCGSAP